jgi:hypothetical protein
MATTTNYGWTTPDDTALVKDGAAAIRTLGSSVDTTTKNLNPETTLGDIAYRSSTANVKTRLGLGTAGQVLTVNSGANAPEWATPASGGMTLISTTSLTGASTTIGSIPGTYNSLFLLIYGVTNATADSYFILTPNNSAGANVYQEGVSNGAADAGVGNAYFALTSFASSPARASTNNIYAVNIYNYASTTNYKIFECTSIYQQGGGTNKEVAFLGAGWADNTAITSLVLSNFGGNLSTGTALLYGVK